jgi:sec-independent protein translocase protein TatB
MFGIDATKLFLLAILAAFLLGPSRMTAAAAWLGRAVRQLRDFTDAAKQRARDEIGPEFDDIEWKVLDPRQYDPRRIIAEAMLAPPTASRGTDVATDPPRNQSPPDPAPSPPDRDR